MPNETQAVEYRTVVVGAGYLVKHILERLGVVAAIDQALTYQPEIETTYGMLAQAISINRMTCDPQPVYHLAEWTQARGIDRLLQIQAVWLDDDRLGGGLLAGVADHAGAIWRAMVGNALAEFKVDLE